MNELRSLAEKATPGPWVWNHPEESPKFGDRGPDLTGNSARLVLSAEGDGDGANLYVAGSDADYIAAAHPQAVLALLDEIDRLRAEIAR